MSDGLILPGSKDFTLQPADVNNLHTNSDVDVSTRSQHHTLGPGPNQAAAGNHAHSVPRLWIKCSASQSIPASVWTRVFLDTQVHRSTEYFDFDSGTNRVTIKKSAGLFLFMYRIPFESGSGGQRYFRLVMYGSYAGAEGMAFHGRVNDGFQTDSNELSDSFYLDLQVGMQIEMHCYSTGATTLRAQQSAPVGTASEIMTSQVQILRLSDWP
jgi:hypothetical protein